MSAAASIPTSHGSLQCSAVQMRKAPRASEAKRTRLWDKWRLWVEGDHAASVAQVPTVPMPTERLAVLWEVSLRLGLTSPERHEAAHARLRVPQLSACRATARLTHHNPLLRRAPANEPHELPLLQGMRA